MSVQKSKNKRNRNFNFYFNLIEILKLIINNIPIAVNGSRNSLDFYSRIFYIT